MYYFFTIIFFPFSSIKFQIKIFNEFIMIKINESISNITFILFQKKNIIIEIFKFTLKSIGK